MAEGSPAPTAWWRCYVGRCSALRSRRRLVAGAVRLQYGDTEFTWHDEHRRPPRSGVPRRGGGAWRTQPRLRDLPRVPAVRHAVHVVPDAVRDDRSPRRSRPRTNDPGRTGSGGRRMLPLRALCHRLSVLTGTWHTGTGHAVARRAQRRLPAADAAGRSDAVRRRNRVGEGPVDHAAARSYRSGRQARDALVTPRQPDRRCRAGLARPEDRPSAHWRLGGPTAAALRPATVLHLVRASPDGDDHRTAGPGDDLRDVRRRVPGARYRSGPGRGLRAQRRRMRAERGALLRRPVAPGRRHRPLPSSGRTEREDARRRDSPGH